VNPADALDDVLWGAWFLWVAWLLRTRHPVTFTRWRLGAAGIALTGLAVTAVGGNWPGTAICAGILVLLARDWWNRRGKRAAKALGSKSLALLARLARKALDAAIPAPEGARV
jgi:hypothetical protein